MSIHRCVDLVTVGFCGLSREEFGAGTHVRRVPGIRRPSPECSIRILMRIVTP